MVQVLLFRSAVVRRRNHTGRHFLEAENIFPVDARMYSLQNLQEIIEGEEMDLKIDQLLFIYDMMVKNPSLHHIILK